MPATPRSGGLTWTESHAELLARDGLERGLKQLAEIGVDADGEVGDPDPVVAVQEIVAKEQFDEIIVSTLPRGTSRWLKAKVLQRLTSSVDPPVTHVIGPPERETTEQTLMRVPLFWGIPRRRLKALAKAAVTHEYSPGRADREDRFGWIGPIGDPGWSGYGSPPGANGGHADAGGLLRRDLAARPGNANRRRHRGRPNQMHSTVREGLLGGRCRRPPSGGGQWFDRPAEG
jgi:hypothetical protein